MEIVPAHDGVQTFDFAGFQLRAMLVSDEPEFIGSDVARALEYRSASDMFRGVDEEDKGYAKVRTPGGEQKMITVNESGLYTAIVRANTERAKPFRRWVTSEVLPAIRKTGSYGAPIKELTGEELMAKALVEAQNVLAAKDKKLAELAPIAEYYETNVSADDVLTIKDWGLVYGVQGNDAYEILKEKKLIYRKLIGERWSKKKKKTEEVYEYRIRKGVPSEWFSLRSQHNVERHHNGQVRQTLYVVAKYSVDIAKAAGIYGGSQEVLEVA